MAWVATDNFDSYSNGDLHGQNGGSGWASGWNGHTSFDIQGTTTYQGSKAVLCTNPTGQNIYRQLSSDVSGAAVVYVAVRRSVNNSGSLIVSFRNTTAGGGDSRAKVTLNSSGRIIVGDGGSTTDYAAYSANTWYPLRFTFNTSTNSFSLSYYNGSSWAAESSTVTMVNSGDIRYVMFDGGTGTVNNFYDLITATDPTTPPSYTATHTLDALLKKAVSASHSLDVLLKKTVTPSHTLDALLKKAITAAHTLDAYLQFPTPTLTHTVDAYITKERLQLKKSLLARVSRPDGTFLTTWEDIDFGGYTKQLNGGPSECVIDYAVPFDYDGEDLREGNEVELVISDADTQLATVEDGTFGARQVYRGYISLIERNIDGSSEHVRAHLLGFYTLLALDVLKSGSQTTLYSVDPAGLTTTQGDLEPADIGLMARTVIDRFNAEHGTGKVFYDPGDVPDTGTDATYVFNQKTYREALDILKSLAPANVYWYVDETGRVSFRAPSSEPDHRFIFGRHFSKVYVERSLEKVRNVALIWDGDTIYKQYTDPASIALYGRRSERINDYGISDEDAADAAGAKFLAENKDPGLKLTCVIIDNNNTEGRGYDIESIQPGDTCALQGFSSTLSDIFRDNMLITTVRYNLDHVEIEVELTKSGLVDVQARHGREIADIGSGGLGIPATYS